MLSDSNTKTYNVLSKINSFDLNSNERFKLFILTLIKDGIVKNQKEICKTTNISGSSLSAYAKKRPIPDKIITLLQLKYDLNPSWFYSGHGNIFALSSLDTYSILNKILDGITDSRLVMKKELKKILILENLLKKIL